MNVRYDIRCEGCGKFCKPVDRGTYYGSYADFEPLDPSYFCKDCVDKKIEDPFSTKLGISCWWIRPNYIAVIKSILRHERKHSF